MPFRLVSSQWEIDFTHSFAQRQKMPFSPLAYADNALSGSMQHIPQGCRWVIPPIVSPIRSRPRRQPGESRQYTECRATAWERLPLLGCAKGSKNVYVWLLRAKRLRDKVCGWPALRKRPRLIWVSRSRRRSIAHVDDFGNPSFLFIFDAISQSAHKSSERGHHYCEQILLSKEKIPLEYSSDSI